MTFAEVLTAISTSGFPIVACCAMACFFVKIINNYRADIKEINAQHKQEIDALLAEIREINERHKQETAAMVEAINNNTMVIQKLVDRMDGDK